MANVFDPVPVFERLEALYKPPPVTLIVDPNVWQGPDVDLALACRSKYNPDQIFILEDSIESVDIPERIVTARSVPIKWLLDKAQYLDELEVAFNSALLACAVQMRLPDRQELMLWFKVFDLANYWLDNNFDIVDLSISLHVEVPELSHFRSPTVGVPFSWLYSLAELTDIRNTGRPDKKILFRYHT